MRTGEIEQHDPYAALRVKEFLFFLNTRFFLSLAIQMQGVTIGWQIYRYTQDVLSLGLIGLAEAIPFIVVSLFSGHVADTYNRKKILVTFTSLLTLTTFTLLFFSVNNQTILSSYGVMPFYIVVSCIGIVRGFLAATVSPFMSQIVPRKLYTNASTWNSSIWHLAAVLGPAVAGLLCSISFEVSYKFNIAFLFLGILSLLFIKSKPIPTKNKNETFFESLSAGVKFVSGNQLILGALSLDLFAVLFGGAIAILPVYADKILHISQVQLGLLTASPAIGAIAMAIILAYKPPTKRAGVNLLVSVAGFGLATILFAISTNFYLSMFFLFLTGAFDSVSVVLRQTILQLSTPDEMRGRVSAVNSIFIGSSNEIGAFESGFAADKMGLKASVIFGGTMTLIIVFITSKVAPKLRNLNLTTLE